MGGRQFATSGQFGIPYRETPFRDMQGTGRELAPTLRGPVQGDEFMTEVIPNFRDLHAHGCFTMPNAWDAASARLLAGHGFEAIGTTSAGTALQLGVRDAGGRVSLDQCLENVARIAGAVDIPVSADLENGYADEPEAVARNVRACAQVGASGCSIEDWSGSGFYDRERAVERVAAAVEAAEAIGPHFVLTARADQVLYHGEDGLDEGLARLERFAATGAHCVYAPGIRDRDVIRDLVASVGAPVNVLVGIAGMAASYEEMRALGVRRLSVGGSLSRLALTAVAEAAAEMARGDFGFPDRALSGDELLARSPGGSPGHSGAE